MNNQGAPSMDQGQPAVSRLAQRRQQMRPQQDPTQDWQSQPQAFQQAAPVNTNPQYQDPGINNQGHPQDDYSQPGLAMPSFDDGSIDYGSTNGLQEDMVLQDDGYGSTADDGSIDLMGVQYNAAPEPPVQQAPPRAFTQQNLQGQNPQMYPGTSNPTAPMDPMQAQNSWPQQPDTGQYGPYGQQQDWSQQDMASIPMSSEPSPPYQQQPLQQSPFAGIPQVSQQGIQPAGMPMNDAAPTPSSAPEPPEDTDVSPLDKGNPKAILARTKKKMQLKNAKAKDNRATRNSHVSKLVDAHDGVKRAKTRRIIVYIAIIAIIGIGIFRAVVPPKTLSQNDVVSIASTVTGSTGFPTESGAAIATQFTQAYIETYGDPAASKLLNTFYTGQSSEQSTGDNSSGTTPSSSNISQKIKYGPYVYNASSNSAKSGNYTVGALIYQIDNRTSQIITEEDGKTPQYKWEFFDVGVYYDSKSNSFGIFKDSPTIISESKMTPQSSIPEGDLPGDGVEQQDAKTQELTNTVHDFMEAWVASKATTLDVLSAPGANYTVKQGLNGLYTLDGDVDYKVYGPPTDGSDNYTRVLVTVNLKDTVSSDSSVTYPSTYVLKVTKKGNKWLVAGIASFKYVVSDTDSNKSE